ncbi:hypothetical protein EDD11_005748 [Mortierella claussenii]|nr:hypothetical protein EDD11_005748 [Mortierella claussenii]
MLEQTDEWLSISLKEPYLLVASNGNSDNTEGATPEHRILEGAVTVRVTKVTKVRWLRLRLVGSVRSAFSFDSSIIPTAKPCEPIDKFSYGYQTLDLQSHLLSGERKEPHTLSVGTHTFPFIFQVPTALPPSLSSAAINVNYQVVASCQLVSFLPFSQPYHVAKPIILLQRDSAPDDSFYTGGTLRLASKNSTRLTGRITSPCLIFPQGGSIPLMIYLSLQGSSTFVTKVAIELWESVIRVGSATSGTARSNQYSGEEPRNIEEMRLDERLVSRQNCPIAGWPSSSAIPETNGQGEQEQLQQQQPTFITKRLLFKAPDVPLEPWAEETDEITLQDRRSRLPKGFCHSSGTYLQVGVRIEHTLRVLVYLQGTPSGHKQLEAGSAEEDIAEQDIQVCVIGSHQQEASRTDETLPPSYHRSFTNLLVDGIELAEIDRRSVEALHQDLVHHYDHLGLQQGQESSGGGPSPITIALQEPPCYEESIRSTLSSTTLVTTGLDGRSSLDVRSFQESLEGESSASGSTRPSTDTFAYDVAAYTARYSYATTQ